MKNSSQTREINHKTGILTAYIEKDSKNSSRKSTKNTKRKNFVKIKQHKKSGQHCPITFGGEGEIRLAATASMFALIGSVSLGRGFGGICATHNSVV